MKNPPSFWKEVLSVLWVMVKIAVPLVVWLFVCYLIGRRNTILAISILYGGILLFMILFSARSNYNWKRRDFVRQERSHESRQKLRELLDRVNSVHGDRTAPTSHLEGQAKHMPLDYLTPEPLKLSDVPAGQDAYLNFTAVTVELDGSTWVDIDASLYDKPNFMSVTVRQLEGGYRLTLPRQREEGSQMKFTPKRRSSACNYAPVVEIAEAVIP